MGDAGVLRGCLGVIVRHRRVSRRTFHLRSERGVSLVASLLVLAFFSISATSAVYFSSRTSSGAEFSAEATDSLALAESGMNLARSTLFSAPDPTDSSAVPFTQATIEGELVEYWGVYDATTSTWTLTGKGTVLNPNDGSDILRAAESKVAVTAGGGSGQLWDYSSASPSGCMTVSNNAEFDSPLNVDGDLCIRNNGYFTGDSLNVGGTLTVNNNASVGFFGSPIDSANVAGGCTGGVPNPHACTSSDDVYSATPITQDPYSYTPPTIDWATWYADASPGPGHGCTS
ncbi:MAG: hypothetical protein ACE5EV_05435, partial [Gaiellales bacterium]